MRWNKHAEDEAEEFFDTRFDLLGWEIGEIDEKKTLPPHLLHVGFKALLAGSEALSAGSEALPGGSIALPADHVTFYHIHIKRTLFFINFTMRVIDRFIYRLNPSSQ